jgi:2-polyprenyl-3-methyl-5-hydroxy-6-metoxy-1,4-benzoquinol methylase
VKRKVSEFPISTVLPKCPNCQGTFFQKNLPIHNHRFFGSCRQCGLTYTTPLPTDIQLRQIYKNFEQNGVDKTVFNETSDFWEIAKERFSIVTRKQDIKTSKKLLEIGSSYGLFLQNFSDTAWEVYGVEPSHHPAALSQEKWKLGNIHNCIFDDVVYPEATFDTVCCFHVLEHLASPRAFVTKIRKMLKPEGKLFIAVPDLTRVTSNISEYYFINYSLHLMFFTPRTLSSFLKSCGFEVLSITNEKDRSSESGSMLIEAKYCQKKTDNVPIDLVHGRKYAERIMHIKKVLQNSFQEYADSGRTVAIFGGGTHTQGLLDCLGDIDHSIMIIFDDDLSRRDQVINGIRIRPFLLEYWEDVDIIVVSSLASENSILARLHQSRNVHQTPCYGIYRDILTSICPQKTVDRNCS